MYALFALIIFYYFIPNHFTLNILFFQHILHFEEGGKTVGNISLFVGLAPFEIFHSNLISDFERGVFALGFGKTRPDFASVAVGVFDHNSAHNAFEFSFAVEEGCDFDFGVVELFDLKQKWRTCGEKQNVYFFAPQKKRVFGNY